MKMHSAYNSQVVRGWWLSGASTDLARKTRNPRAMIARRNDDIARNLSRRGKQTFDRRCHCYTATVERSRRREAPVPGGAWEAVAP